MFFNYNFVKKENPFGPFSLIHCYENAKTYYKAVNDPTTR